MHGFKQADGCLGCKTVLLAGLSNAAEVITQAVGWLPIVADRTGVHTAVCAAEQVLDCCASAECCCQALVVAGKEMKERFVRTCHASIEGIIR
jgi:hypothetical protein